MKIHTQTELESAYDIEEGRIGDPKGARDEILANFPYSVIITGDFFEIENAEKWCADNTEGFTSLFYEKTAYDFGYIEFFFKNENDKAKFESAVENIITDYSNGTSGMTKGSAEIVKIKTK